MSLAVFLATAFLVGAVGAWHLLRNNSNRGSRLMFSMVLWMAILVTPIQIIAGDLHGENTLEYQPQKVAAMEGDWEVKAPGVGEPLVLFAIPDIKEGRNHLGVSIPHLGSLIFGTIGGGRSSR